MSLKVRRKVEVLFGEAGQVFVSFRHGNKKGLHVRADFEIGRSYYEVAWYNKNDKIDDCIDSRQEFVDILYAHAQRQAGARETASKIWSMLNTEYKTLRDAYASDPRQLSLF